MLEKENNKDALIRKNVQFDDENVTIYDLLLLQLSSGLYEVKESTVVVETVDYNDTIEATELSDGTLLFNKLVKKSILDFYDFILPKKVVDSVLFESLLKRIDSQGGYWETVFGGVVRLYLPKNSSLRPQTEIERIRKIICL